MICGGKAFNDSGYMLPATCPRDHKNACDNGKPCFTNCGTSR